MQTGLCLCCSHATKVFSCCGHYNTPLNYQELLEILAIMSTRGLRAIVRNDTNQEDPWPLQAGCQSVSEGQHLLDHTRSSDQATVSATLWVAELQKSPTSACSCHRQIQSEEKKK